MILHYTTELFIFVDDFFKSFFKTIIGQRLEDFWNGKRGPNKNLSISEVVTLNLIRFEYRVEDLKTFHKIAKEKLKDEFPSIPNYENFLKATNLSIGYILIFLRYLLFLNTNKGNMTHFVDSTDIPVCKNYSIYKYIVAKELAGSGKTSKGWFYGLKVHGVCDERGNLENLYFTSGDVHDNQVLDSLLQNLIGLFVCDSGYMLKKEELRTFMKQNKRFFIATRKNMKRLMSKEQLKLFRKRSIIETNWSVLKERFKIIYSLARNIFGLLRHYLYSLTSFMLSRFDSKITYEENIMILNK